MRPILEYSSAVWDGNLTQTQAIKLEAGQRRAVKPVYNMNMCVIYLLHMYVLYAMNFHGSPLMYILYMYIFIDTYMYHQTKKGTGRGTSCLYLPTTTYCINYRFD